MKLVTGPNMRAPAGTATATPPGPLWPGGVRGAVLVEWMLPGGYGSTDPGLGMNRAPGRLYLAVVVVLCSCRLRLAENDIVCFPSGPGEAAPGTGPGADGPGCIRTLSGDRQLRLS